MVKLCVCVCVCVCVRVLVVFYKLSILGTAFYNFLNILSMYIQLAEISCKGFTPMCMYSVHAFMYGQVHVVKKEFRTVVARYFASVQIYAERDMQCVSRSRLSDCSMQLGDDCGLEPMLNGIPGLAFLFYKRQTVTRNSGISTTYCTHAVEQSTRQCSLGVVHICTVSDMKYTHPHLHYCTGDLICTH